MVVLFAFLYMDDNHLIKSLRLVKQSLVDPRLISFVTDYNFPLSERELTFDRLSLHYIYLHLLVVL